MKHIISKESELKMKSKWEGKHTLVKVPGQTRVDTHTEMRHDTCDGERHTCPMFNTLMANVGLSENQNVMHDSQISYCTKVLWLRRNLPLYAQVKFGIINLIL